MSRPRPLALVAVILSALLWCSVAPVIASASTPGPIADCKAHNGALTHHYTVQQLQAALKALPTGVQGYFACSNAIQDQIATDTGASSLNPGGSSSSSGGGSGTLIVIIVVVVVLLAGGGGAFWAYRRNRANGDLE